MAEAGGMLTFLVGMNSCIGHMPMQLGNPGFYNFFERFLPAFHIGFDSERRSRIKDYAQLPSYDIYIVTEKPSDNINRIYIKPDNDNWDIRIELAGGYALFGDVLSQIRNLPGISMVKEI